MKKLFVNVANVIYTNGWVEYNDYVDATNVVCINRHTLSIKHWWQCDVIKNVYIPIEFTIFSRDIDDKQWFRLKHKKRVPISRMLFESFVCNSSLSIIGKPHTNSESNAVEHIPLFLNGTRTLGPQALAMLYGVKHNMTLLTFNVKYNTNNIKVSYGYTLIHNWTYFAEFIMKNVPAKLCNFYENVPNTSPVSLYIDFDCKRSDYPLLEVNECVDMLISIIDETMDESYPTYKKRVSLNNVFVFSSSNENKISLHLVGMQTLMMFENTRALCAFIMLVREKVFIKVTRKPSKCDNREHLVDLTVYDHNSKFRLLGSTKIEKIIRPKKFIKRQKHIMFEYKNTIICKKEYKYSMLLPRVMYNYTVDAKLEKINDALISFIPKEYRPAKLEFEINKDMVNVNLEYCPFHSHSAWTKIPIDMMNIKILEHGFIYNCFYDYDNCKDSKYFDFLF